MAAAALRAKQAPIKDAYRNDPASAIVTLSSAGTLDSSSISCRIDTGRAVHDAQQKVAGLHPKAGGDEPDISGAVCSGDMLLEALVACSGVTLKAVATALDIPIQEGTVRAEGDVDFKGTMGVDRNAPVGFTAIRLGFDLKLQQEVPPEKLEKLGKLTERVSLHPFSSFLSVPFGLFLFFSCHILLFFFAFGIGEQWGWHNDK